MGYLQDILDSGLGAQLEEKIAKQAGVKPEETSGAVDIAIDAILTGLQKNASTPGGAGAIDDALDKNHDGSILDDVLGWVGKADVQQDGDKIVNHIFGNDKDDVLDQLSQKTGIPKEGMIALMVSLAPIIMGKLGQARKQTKERSQQAGTDKVADVATKDDSSVTEIISTIFGMVGSTKTGSSPKNDTVVDLINLGATLFGKKH